MFGEPQKFGPERRRPLGRPRLDGGNIKLALREVVWYGVDSIHPTHDRVK